MAGPDVYLIFHREPISSWCPAVCQYLFTHQEGLSGMFPSISDWECDVYSCFCKLRTKCYTQMFFSIYAIWFLSHDWFNPRDSTNLCERALICAGWLVDQHWMNLLAPSLKKSAWALLVVNPKNVQFIATAPRLEQILTDRWRHFQADDSQSIIHIRVIVWFKTDLSVTNDSDTWLIPDDSFLDDSLWIWCGSYFKTIWSLNWIWESVKKLRKASSVNFNRISEGRDIITFSTNQIRSSVPTNERQEMFEADWFILKGEEHWRAANIFLQVDAGYIKVRYHFPYHHWWP